MMISPEYYYKITLEGKNQQEILKEIRSLKREINSRNRNRANYYSDGQKPARFSGSNAYPYNFDALISFLGTREAYEDDDEQD